VRELLIAKPGTLLAKHVYIAKLARIVDTAQLDGAFGPSLVTYFRRRLHGSPDPGRLFAKVRQVVAATGVLAGRHRRTLEWVVLDDAVATQDTVTQLIAAVRQAIREVPSAAEVAGRCCTAHDYADPGKPKIAWDDEETRAALVTDALNLSGCGYSGTRSGRSDVSPTWKRETSALGSIDAVASGIAQPTIEQLDGIAHGPRRPLCVAALSSATL
jgi:hypothetical protein